MKLAPTMMRRFPSVLPSRPSTVKELSPRHEVIEGKTTLFPTRIVTAAESPNLLVSGHNNRKIGRMVTKGPWAGMPIYTLTLTERATCPSYCPTLQVCMGNGMQWARRHQVGPKFEARLEREVEVLARANPSGFVVRLHVLGDFYTVAYVDLWGRMLHQHPALRVYGYTSRRLDDPIGARVAGLNEAFPTRCYIRFSDRTGQRAMGATVIAYEPDGPRVEEGLVCPAERMTAECCATCGLCWSEAMRGETIVFVLHGPSAPRGPRRRWAA